MSSVLLPIKRVVAHLLELWYKDRAHEPIEVPPFLEGMRRFFDFADISFLDVGARGGPLNQFQLFAPFSHLFVCEPDPAEVVRIEKKLKIEGRWKKVTTIPAALASKEGTVVLHQAEKAGMSSLLDANSKEIKKYYSISGEGRVEKDISVPSLTLDAASEQYGMKNLSVIKLDTQGTELDILKSGPRTLSSVLAVYIEIEFIPLYMKRPSPSEIQTFLESAGFRLIDFKRTVLRRRTIARPIYSKRELSWAHGLYIRERNSDRTPLTPEQLLRLACCLFAFEYFDYAVSLLEEPQLAAYIRQQGFGKDLAHELAAYSGLYWQAFKTRFNWLEKREILGTIYTDRKHER